MDKKLCENTLLKMLNERNIEVQYERNFIDNLFRFFVYEGQKIYIDDQSHFYGAEFRWKMNEIQGLFELIDKNVKEGDEIWASYAEETGSDDYNDFIFRWGHKEYLLSVEFGCRDYYINNDERSSESKADSNQQNESKNCIDNCDEYER